MSKILITVYYYDFARFFNEVAKQLVDKHNCTVDFVCFYPSSSYFLRKYTSFKYFELFKLRSDNYNDGYSTHYDFTIACDSRIASYPDMINKEANAIHDFWMKEIPKYDLVISSGDTRPQTTIMLDVANKENIPIIFFEQGPYGTTMIDNEGVNANISFLPDFNREFDEKIISAINSYKKKISFLALSV